MAKKKVNRETTIEDFYDLKVDKVDELVAVLKGESTEEFGEVSMNISDCTGVDDPANYRRGGAQKKFDPYKTDFLGKIPAWVKALFVKWWFAGVICYFVNMGLGLAIKDTLDLVVVSGLVTGLVVELFVNPIFRFLETDKREFDKYTMFPFPFRAYWTFFANMLYYVLIAFGVNGCYYIINTYMFNLAIEPLLFGVFVVAVDMVFIGIKDGLVALAKKLKKREVAPDV